MINILKRQALAITFGVTKPHVYDDTNHHPHLYTFIARVEFSSNFMIFRDIFDYVNHKNHGVICRVLFFVYRITNHGCIAGLNSVG